MTARKLVRLLARGLCGLLLASQCYAEKTVPAVIIIIDDLGYNLEQGKQVLTLPGKLNLAFLPHLANTHTLAEAAHQQGHDILLHAPMSTIEQRPLDPGALTEAMNQQQFTDTLQHALNSVPHAIGVNNHMGSLLTQRPQAMAWLMQELKRKQLYFIDSRTTKLTVAAHQAKNYQVPHMQRKVFLDNNRNIGAIERQFEALLSHAQQYGQAVAIGHPYPETVAVLKKRLPTLALRGYRSLYISEALQLSSRKCPAKNKPCWAQQLAALSSQH